MSWPGVTRPRTLIHFCGKPFRPKCCCLPYHTSTFGPRAQPQNRTIVHAMRPPLTVLPYMVQLSGPLLAQRLSIITSSILDGQFFVMIEKCKKVHRGSCCETVCGESGMAVIIYGRQRHWRWDFQSPLSRNSHRSLKTIAYPKRSLFGQENNIYRRLLGQKQGLWRHFGDTPFQGTLAICSIENWDHFSGDMSLI